MEIMKKLDSNHIEISPLDFYELPEDKLNN